MDTDAIKRTCLATGARVIGVCGKRRSGKDTFAKHVIQRHVAQRRWTRIAFADALRKELNQILAAMHVTGFDFTKDITDANKENLRPLLIGWGMFRRDHCGSNFWLQQVASVIELRARMHHSTVITDVRFANEAAFVHACGGVLVRVIRPGVEERYHGSALVDKDRSETDSDSFVPDFTVTNNGTFEDMENSVKLFEEWYGIRHYSILEGQTLSGAGVSGRQHHQEGVYTSDRTSGRDSSPADKETGC